MFLQWIFVSECSVLCDSFRRVKKNEKKFIEPRSPRRNKNPLPNGIICEDIKITKTCLGQDVVECDFQNYLLLADKILVVNESCKTFSSFNKNGNWVLCKVSKLKPQGKSLRGNMVELQVLSNKLLFSIKVFEGKSIQSFHSSSIQWSFKNIKHRTDNGCENHGS